MNRTLRTLQILALLAALLAVGTVGADDEGIYGPNAPPQSAFMRLFNATPHPLPGVRLGAEDIGEIAAYGASEFVFVPPGPYSLAVNGARQTFQLAPNRYYTAVLRDGKLHLLDNERYRNRLKALVIVYNLLDGELSLRTADGRTTVVEKVAPSKLGTREVNPVRTSLALFKGTERLADVKSVTFERGRAFSLFVAGTAEQPVPVWVVN